jgi:transposase-like protein
MARRTYDDRDRAMVFAYLSANGGNVKRTAREYGMPPSVVRDWKQKWEREGVPAEVQETLPSIQEELVNEFTRIRNKGLKLLESQMDEGTLKGQPLVNAIGMLTDKIRLFRGESTSRSETVAALPAPEQLRELVGTFFKEAVEAAQERAAEIDDADWEPIPLRELPSAREEVALID